MRVKNHKIEGIPYRAAKAIGRVIVPEIVILHDTAGRLDKGNSAGYLRDNPAGVSVHFVVERDGSIEQQVPTNRRAGHAGKSSYHGRTDCNAFAIGIEIVNPGKMLVLADGMAQAWWGEMFAPEDLDWRIAATPQHGRGAWATYTGAQIEALERLLTALFTGIPTLRDITTHWYVSPGRKVDTNPLFPLDELRAAVFGPFDPADGEAEAASEEVPTATMLRIHAPGDTLNMRRWPSFNPNVIGAIPDGTLVPALRRGVFDGRAWFLVQYAGREGWIVDAYAALA